MEQEMTEKVVKTDAEWKQQLTEEQYKVARRKGTERAFTGAYWDNHEDGVYRCICCDTPLFNAGEKFDSGTGWPSFWKPAVDGNVATEDDTSFFMRRTEAVCPAIPATDPFGLSCGSYVTAICRRVFQFVSTASERTAIRPSACAIGSSNSRIPFRNTEGVSAGTCSFTHRQVYRPFSFQVRVASGSVSGRGGQVSPPPGKIRDRISTWNPLQIPSTSLSAVRNCWMASARCDRNWAPKITPAPTSSP